MTITSQLVTVAGVFLVLGWVLHMIWDGLLDAFYEMTGWVTSIAWDLFAILGILAVVSAIGFSAVHYHWFGGGT